MKKDAERAIREVMKLRGLTQIKLAKRLNITQGALSETLKGDMKLSTFTRILRAMQCNIVIQLDELDITI